MTVALVFLGCLITVTVLPLDCHCLGSPLALSLKRAFPLIIQTDMRPYVDRDRMRHAITLQSPTSSRGIISYRLNGSLTLGLYVMRVHLGSPPRAFNVQIDTGSDIFWVACSSDLSAKSSTARLVNCTNEMCLAGQRSGDSFCSTDDHLCNYKLDYVDESSSSGHLVSDVLHFQSSSGELNHTAPVVFGCTTEAVDNTDMNYDGIMGLGRNALSIVSQLASQRISPKAFTHCLSGDEEGGGTLLFGAIRRPDMVYTPIVRSKVDYTVNLKSIHVNGQPAPIDPSAFATSSNSGTVIDSGTTLAYLAVKVYDPFVQTVSAAISTHARPFISAGAQCYSTSTSVHFEVFPQVRFAFAGGASMLLSPEDYVQQGHPIDGAATWCLQFWRADHLPGVTILGDLILKNKIIVYDLGAQRIGWVNYNCSVPLNMSMVDTGKAGNQYRAALPWTLLSCVTVLVAALRM